MNARPRLLGILNITEDSFSDGGRYLAPEAARGRADALVAGGCDIVDVGAAASNPRAKAVTPQTEIVRLTPVVAHLKELGVRVSVDSFSPEVQRWALSEGADYLNDIHGFPHRDLYDALAAAKAHLVVMHAVQEEGRAEPVFVPPETILGRIVDFFGRRIAALTGAGVARERLILDPGMGLFLGTSTEASCTVLRHLRPLKEAFSLPLLVSVSRKSFLRKLTGRGPEEAGAATLAAELFAAAEGADYIRTHDPAALRDALLVRDALRKSRCP